ncbi:MAG: hypothetical protein JOY71_14700 [Acetobacteraceae bacterium]|nr:hypothetical protein [Acetobacteraceae bacterium]
MDAEIAAAVPLSSPAAAQRCAEGAGLDSGAAAQHNPPCRRSLPAAALAADHLPTGDATRYGASTPVSNLHQLDGRDPPFSLPIALYILGCAIIRIIATVLLTDYTNKDISAEYERV